jgi:hypothetical protein
MAYLVQAMRLGGAREGDARADVHGKLSRLMECGQAAAAFPRALRADAADRSRSASNAALRQISFSSAHDVQARLLMRV